MVILLKKQLKMNKKKFVACVAKNAMSVVFGLYLKKGIVSRIILLVILIFLMRGFLRARAFFATLATKLFFIQII